MISKLYEIIVERYNSVCVCVRSVASVVGLLNIHNSSGSKWPVTRLLVVS